MFVRNLFLAGPLFVAATAAIAQTALLAPPTPLAASAPTAVPALVPFTGIVETSAGRPISGETLVTFSLFKEEQGGEALWSESQTVQPDLTGHYKVQLGASSPAGLPLAAFATGEGRWLEIQVAGQKQQPRVLLMSVPYAIKAADAETLGGLPASAYALAGSPTAGNTLSAAATVSPDAGATVTTPGGTAGFLPLFTGGTVIGNSLLSETGTQVGIGTTSPLATLDINGTLAVRGELGIAAMGYATTSKSYLSQPFDLIASAYNSKSKAPAFPQFQLQAEPTGNNTATPGATLNLLYGNGAAPKETGLSISPTGILNFAPGQTFPGNGTITGVTAGTDLLGGGTTGNVTLSLDTTKVAQLAAANSFVGTQTVTAGDIALPATTSPSSGVITVGGVPFLFSQGPSSANAFLGGAGNFTTGGSVNTAVGYDALAQQTSGSENTAVGTSALTSTTTGIQNTAVGADTLTPNVTGSDNTALGFLAHGNIPTLNNTTTLGANAVVSQNNSLVLGNTKAGSPGTDFVNVGIGTDTPRSVLEASVSSPGALGPTLILSNPGNGQGAAASIDFKTNNFSSANSYSPSSRIVAVDDGLDGDDLYFVSLNSSQSSYPYNQSQQTNMIISSSGQVGIPYTSFSDYGAYNGAQLTVTGISGYGTPDAGPQQPVRGIAGISSSGGNSLNLPGGDGGDFVAGNSSFFIAGTGADGGTFVGGNVSTSGPQVPGYATTSGDGIYAAPGGGSAYNFVQGNAATLNGNVSVTGTLTAATKDFKIDHPADPANKYLYHASVESSEMMDIYSGNVVTDELGIATVTLPSWFESLNTDFRYQLTTIGRDAHAWISQEVANGKFVISTNATAVKVSWQITAVRQDAYAKAHPLVVEQAKPAGERGYYQHPELYGQPAEMQTEWGRHPEQMRRLQAQRANQELQRTQGAHPASGLPAGPPASAVNRKYPQHAVPAMKPIAASAAPAPLTGHTTGR